MEKCLSKFWRSTVNIEPMLIKQYCIVYLKFANKVYLMLRALTTKEKII